MAQGRDRPYLRVPQGEGFGIATSFSFALANPKFFITMVALSWFSVWCRILIFSSGPFQPHRHPGQVFGKNGMGEITASEAMRT